MTAEVVRATLRDIIFQPSTFSSGVEVSGTVVMVDLERGRIDIADNGARLICDIDGCDITTGKESLAESCVVTVTGVVKKRERRMFLDAVSVSYVS